MFQRYGNWPDALAAYNWGPGNLEAWIAAGRPTERLPSETARYVRRVLRDALVASAARW
jgi:soluble lytic murein transglycosylase-like protein